MDEIDYYGIQSIRLRLKEGSIDVPNLYTVASNLMFQPPIDCPPEFSQPLSLQPPSNPYTNLSQYIETVPSIRRMAIKHQCTINKNQRTTDLFIFRNNNQQGSKVIFFDEDIATKIPFFRVEAATYMDRSHRLCMIIIKNGVQKLIVVDRVEKELDILFEYDVKLGFHCVDIKYIRSEDGREYIIVFSGYQNKPHIILVFEYNRGITFVLKKNLNSESARLFPIIYETNIQEQTYLYLIGGRKQATGESECYLSYQYFNLQNLFCSESSIDSKIQQLSHKEYSQLKRTLFNGVINNNFLIVPNNPRIYSIRQRQNKKIEIVKSHFQIAGEDGKHRRFLSNEVLIHNINQLQLEYVHICHQNQKYVKRQRIRQQRQGHPSCRLI